MLWVSKAALFGWILLVVATLYVCYFSHLGAIGFVGPDEPRYAWIAREMSETGDWVTPRLYGKPWFEKPILYYWGAALSFKIFGVNEAAARLPSAVSALLATLALAWLAWKVYDADVARWLLLLLPTTVGMIGFSHAAATDMPFAGMLTVAMVCAAVVVGLLPETPGRSKSSHTPWFDLILFGFFMGAAVLAKGPAAILLCGGAVFFWALFTKRWRDAFRLLHPAAILTFCLTALPWYILCARRNPDFLRIFIIEHNFKRYLTPEFQHIQPFWYYVPILILALLPWTWGLFVWRSGNRRVNREFIFFLSFAFFPIFFFSLSKSKLPGYILPAIPPFALLLTNSLNNALKFDRKVGRVTVVLLATTILGFGIGIRHYVSNHILGQDILPAPWTISAWLPLILAGIAAATLATVRKTKIAMYTLHLALLLALLGLYGGLHWMDPKLSAKGIIKTAFPSSQTVPEKMVYAFDLPRGVHYGLNFYFHREIPGWNSQIEPKGSVFTSWKGKQQLVSAGYSCQSQIVYPAAILCSPKPPDSSGER